jgi:arsenate reductase-like glutaredoxin family protein
LQDGVELDERDFFSDRFTEQELRQLIGEREPSEFFSWSSPSFRKMDLKRENLTGEQLVELMLDEPRLIRRPLIRVGDDLIVGTDKTAMSQAFE